MFARRQSALAASAGSPPPSRGLRLDPRRLLARLRRPPVAVAAAAVLFAGAGAALVAVLGDPRAGLPSLRAPVERPTPREAPAPTGLEAFTLDSLGLYQDLTVPDGEPGVLDAAASGQAIITIPGAGSAPGAAIRQPPADPLPAAPIAGLSQPGPHGALPVIAPDGRTPFQAYARPFRGDGRPKVALIVGGLGLNAAATRAAIEQLPPEITLAFVPYAEGLQGWIDLARADGHEVLLEIPMEPADYPDNDPGPYTLLAAADGQEIQRRMEWLLGRATGYAGVTNYLGDRFVQSDGAMTAFLQVLRARGLGFIDDGQARRRPGAWARASADRVVDETQDAAAIVAALNALETAARDNGQALGSGYGFPVTVQAAARWAQGLEARGLQLAPASALAQRPGVSRAP